MTSSVLCAETGIDNSELFDNSAAYIAGWLSALNHDRTLVIAAAAQAQRACDLINPGEREALRDPSAGPEVATVTCLHDVSDRRADHTAPATDHRGSPGCPPERTSGWEAEAS
jgi:hypothetical protein